MKRNRYNKNRPILKEYKSLLSIKIANSKAYNITSRICQALHEVKMIKEGKLKAKTMDELLDGLTEIDDGANTIPSAQKQRKSLPNEVVMH